MIQITLTQALALYSTFLALVVVAIWLYTELTVRRYQVFLAKQFLWRCVYCSYTYLDERAERVSQCPRCESFNSLEDKHARFVPASASYAGADGRSNGPVAKGRNSSHRRRPHQHKRGPRKRR